MESSASIGLMARTTGLVFRFGTAEFDADKFELRVAGSRVNAQPKPLELLKCLLMTPDKVLTRDHLIRQIWGIRPTVFNVLPNAIGKLRAALGDENADYIVSVTRIGYLFSGSVERIDRASRENRSLPPVGISRSQTSTQPQPHLTPGTAESIVKTCGNWPPRRHMEPNAHPRRYAFDAKQLESLKRDALLLNFLAMSTKNRDHFVEVAARNFDVAPYFIEYQHCGHTLLDWNNAGTELGDRFSCEHRINLFMKIAAAVADAHRVDVIHLNLRPDNIFILAGSEAKHSHVRLGNFGIGRLMRTHPLHDAAAWSDIDTQLHHEDLTTSAMSIYSAPELLMGDVPSPQSDIFSLGVILFQILIGNFRMPLATGWKRHIKSLSLRKIISAATDSDPQRGFLSVNDMVKHLHRSMGTDHQPIATLTATQCNASMDRHPLLNKITTSQSKPSAIPGFG